MYIITNPAACLATRACAAVAGPDGSRGGCSDNDDDDNDTAEDDVCGGAKGTIRAFLVKKVLVMLLDNVCRERPFSSQDAVVQLDEDEGLSSESLSSLPESSFPSSCA